MLPEGARPRAPSEIKLDFNFGSFRRFHSLAPPFSQKTSAPSATTSGKPSARRQLRLFPSVLRLLPASGTEKGGRAETKWVKGRDTGQGRGPGSHLALPVGRVEEKKGRSRGRPRKVARDKSSQRGEGRARPLRRLAARLCAPAQVGSVGARDGLLRLRGGRSKARFSLLREGYGCLSLQGACACASLPFLRRKLRSPDS